MEVVKFADIVSRVNTKEDRFNTDKIYYVGGDHIDSNELMVRQRGIIKGSTIGPMFYCGFKAGDILFVTRNPHLRKCAVVDFDGICSEKTFVLATKDSSKLLQEYLALIMQSDEFWAYCDENKSGGVNFFLNWSTLAEYEFALPSIEEQKVLADKLWAAYKVKESYRQLLSTTDEMLKVKFQEMFGDPFTNSKKWKEYGPFSKYTEIILGTTPKSSEPSFWDGNVLWITPAEMNDEVVLYEDTIRHITLEGAKSAHLSILPKGTVLFSTRAPIGKVGIVGKEMYCNQGFKNFHCGELLNEYYLYYSLLQNREYLQSLGTGSTFKELSKSTIEKLCIAVPPIEQQLDFERVFTQAEATKASLRASIEAIDKVIRSLINQ